MSVARKSTQVDCPLRITHARAVARCTIAREQIGALLDLLRGEFRRALLSCGAYAEERQAEARGHKSVHAAVSFGHQRKRRHRTTHRNEVIVFHPPVDGAADAGKHGDELTSL